MVKPCLSAEKTPQPSGAALLLTPGFHYDISNGAIIAGLVTILEPLSLGNRPAPRQASLRNVALVDAGTPQAPSFSALLLHRLDTDGMEVEGHSEKAYVT